jgi:hypothetical protein
VFDDGSLSSNFDLDRGDTQGNTPSPILYNMAQQILLFKIELCPEIKSIYVNHLVPRPMAMPLMLPLEEDEEFTNEADRETDKAEGFADDTSGLTLFEIESLSIAKKILIDFGIFSGLKCNVDKTVLMQIGNRIDPSAELINLGFNLVDTIRILGMDIDCNAEDLDHNFVLIHEKIK